MSGRRDGEAVAEGDELAGVGGDAVTRDDDADEIQSVVGGDGDDFAGRLLLALGAQSLDLGEFEKMMRELQPYIALWGESRKKEVAAAASH